MSPSESDLRAALRDGEGDDPPDVDRLIELARAHRSQRRARVLSAAAAVVVVAAAGVGGAVLWGGSDGNGQQGAAPSASASQFQSRPLSRGRVCPASYPGDSGPTRRVPSATDAGPMFASPVSTVVICRYTATGEASTGTTSVTLSGSDAALVVDSIEVAAKARLHVVCPDIVTAEKAQLAIIARTADGTVLPTVTTDVSIPNCNQPITNGTAVRWAWKPPAAVASRIAGLTRRPTGGLSGGGVIGSPVR